ncbi:MAG: hypothetical protein M1372_00125 [Patescibacteria group bacterium]|nr:hypothetical protein [Patescibacteria group bacterium]
MIAKPNWFNRRKYTGWGLMPKAWQGVVYVVIIVAVIVFIQNLALDETLKMILTGIWAIFVLIDVLQVMASIKLDEREQKIEAIAERNASWTMVASTALVILYITTIGKELKGAELIPALIFPIAAGVIVKGLSNFILDKQGV